MRERLMPEALRRRGTMVASRIVVAAGMNGTGVTLVAGELQNALPTVGVIDAGARWADIAEACAPGFARILVLTTHDVVAVSAAYALVKLVRDRYPDAAVELLVNRSTERDALRTYERVQGAATHFLGETVAYAGAVPDGAAAAEGDGSALVTAALRALAARYDEELDAIAERTALGAAERRR